MGDRLTAYVNGRKLGEARDADLAIGYLGLEVRSSPDHGATFAFDNLVLRGP